MTFEYQTKQEVSEACFHLIMANLRTRNKAAPRWSAECLWNLDIKQIVNFCLNLPPAFTAV